MGYYPQEGEWGPDCAGTAVNTLFRGRADAGRLPLRLHRLPAEPIPKNILNSISDLTGSHLKTYNAIFQHPVSHNLEWRCVRALFNQIAEVVEQPNGNLRVTRNGQWMVLRTPRTKDVADVEELMELRHFLERSEQVPAAAPDGGSHWLLVIDHHQARIYRSEMHGTVPERIMPHEPTDYFRHAHNSRDFSRGQEKPDPNSFFEPVASALKGAGSILVFGSGKGTSSEMEQFVAWVAVHHPELSARIVGSVVVDEHHLSEDQLLSRAREFYSSAPAA
jgi:hypothetical protein